MEQEAAGGRSPGPTSHAPETKCCGRVTSALGFYGDFNGGGGFTISKEKQTAPRKGKKVGQRMRKDVGTSVRLLLEMDRFVKEGTNAREANLCNQAGEFVGPHPLPHKLGGACACAHHTHELWEML